MSFSQILLFTLGCGAIVAAIFLLLMRLFTATRGAPPASLPRPPRLAAAACAHCGHSGPMVRPLGLGLARACARCGR